MASQRAAVALRGHAVDTLTAAGHLTVLGCEDKTEGVCSEDDGPALLSRRPIVRHLPSADMTMPKVTSDLLMLEPSVSRSLQ